MGNSFAIVLNILNHVFLTQAVFLKHCGIGHLEKLELLPDLKLLQSVPKHSFFKLCKFYEKINGQLFATGQNVLLNA